MAWSYVATGAAGNGNNATSLSPGLPAGIQAGDLLVLQVQTFGGTSARTPDTPSDWTPFDGSTGFTQNGTSSHGWWYQIYAAQSAPTITMSGTGVAGDTQLSRIHAFRSSRGSAYAPVTVGAFTPNASADNIGPITGITVPSPANGGEVLTLISAGKSNDFNGQGTLTDYTQAALSESTTGNDAGMTCMYRLNTPSGATGNLTVTDNGGTASNGVGIGVIVAFDEGIVLSPTGSETTAESQDGAFLEIDIIPYVPTDPGTAESGTGTYTTGTVYAATGSEASSESGTPALTGVIVPSSSEASSESGTPVLAGTYPATGSEVTGESGTPSVLGAIVPAGVQSDTESGTPLLAGTYPATGSEVTSESGTGQALQAGTVAPSGSEVTSESGTATAGGGALVPSGSEVAAESQDGAFLDIQVIPYVPADAGSTESGTASIGHTYPATGSEVTTESGTAIAQGAGSLTVPGTGSEVTTEADVNFDVFEDIAPDGSEVTTETSLAAALWRLVPVGSEASSESGAPTVQQGAGALTPTGSELTAETGLADAFSDEIVLAPDGSELVAETGTPLLAGVLTVTGEELLAQTGAGSVSIGTLTLFPPGSEVTAESGTPLLLALLVPSGSELTAETGTALIRGLAVSLGLVVVGQGLARYTVTATGRAYYILVHRSNP